MAIRRGRPRLSRRVLEQIKRRRTKKGPVAKARARKRAKQLAAEAAIKAEVKIREGGMCRVCERLGESAHEIKPKGAGGKVSMENTIWTCGDGVRGCHGFLQRHEITVEPMPPATTIDANDLLRFDLRTAAARRWVDTAEGAPYDDEAMPIEAVVS